MKFLFLFSLILLLGFFIGDSHAQVIDPITVRTDKTSYSHGETIFVSGEVSSKISGEAVNLVMTAPNGNIVTVTAIPVDNYNEYRTELTAGGSLMRAEGTYTINVDYGNQSRSAKTTFYYSGSSTATGDADASTISVSGFKESVRYEISGGKVFYVTPDMDAISLIVSIDTFNEGYVTLHLPRTLIDSKYQNNDSKFFVLVDGDTKDYDETSTSEIRTITIPFRAGSEEIEIIGTHLLSETSQSLSTVPVIEVETNKQTYSDGEILYVTGKVKDILGGEAVSLIITHPTGEIFVIDQLRVNRDKAFSTSVELGDESMESGKYTIVVQYGTQSRTATTTFEYIDDFTFPTKDDYTPPKILQPTDITTNAETQNGARVSFDVLAIDDVDELVIPYCNPVSGSIFPIGSHVVVCDATDSASNRAAQVSFTVTVNPPGITVPNWIKNIAEFWCDDKIDNASFIEGIQYLIDNEIILITATTSANSDSQSIPPWIKNNACWWSEGQITDEDFVKGIEYLVSNGIINVAKGETIDIQFDFDSSKEDILKNLSQIGRSTQFLIKFDADKSTNGNQFQVYKIVHDEDGWIGDMSIYYGKSDALWHPSEFDNIFQLKVFLSNENGAVPTTKSESIVKAIAETFEDELNTLGISETPSNWIENVMVSGNDVGGGERKEVLSNDSLEVSFAYKKSSLGFFEFIITEKS
ncbi:HYR domain-containing protein [Nitrosopumilus sp. K4]|uniref:HYR domain-containing protein n=1 Tax=Nitrosopumilus sp. K4 TaxID=2795383 RepID=UPI001BA6115E|nr:HYR domain-containing protein [Nitrosopumilus sp. K4]QUC64374.1 HYR domain-containing protein [Nitrosopumilus sp. K4]